MYDLERVVRNIKLLTIIYEVKFDSEEDFTNAVEKLKEGEKMGPTELIGMNPKDLSLFIRRRERELESWGYTYSTRDIFENYLRKELKAKKVDCYIKEEFPPIFY